MKRILLVDDDTHFRRSLALSLEGEGYGAGEAENGIEALEGLKHSQKGIAPYDCVIVDARMPGIDGFLLAEQIAAIDGALKIIILSAYPYPENYNRYLTLTKPVRLPVLMEALEGKNRQVK